MDFLADQLFDGRKLRVLTIVDICTKLCPAIGVAHAYKGHDVVATLEAAAREQRQAQAHQGRQRTRICLSRY